MCKKKGGKPNCDAGSFFLNSYQLGASKYRPPNYYPPYRRGNDQLQAAVEASVLCCVI